MNREQQRIWNAMAVLVAIDKNNPDYQNAFYMLGIKNAKDNSEIQAFVDGMGTAGSAVERDFSDYVLNNGSTMRLLESFAKERGINIEDVFKLLNKDPLQRTEEEQLMCVRIRREIEKQAFPENKVHEEQSNLEGKDVAEDNNLGTEQPNGESVKQELDNLANAEEGLDALMRDNDVFHDNFERLQKEGMTNPQIFDWMIQRGGMTEKQLKPFADYINANARVQGMQQATQQKIEELVGRMVQDWSYRGTMNGQKTEGEQVVYVQDRDGRTLIVGSGDVAFDTTTGRAKEDVGDMLVCFDPNKKEMVYVKVDDVTFMQTQKPEDFGNEYRQRLEEINSQAYNEAAQEQAERNANKPQQEGTPDKSAGSETVPEKTEPNKNNSKLYKVADSLQGKIGQNLSKDEADGLVSEMEKRAEPARELELTPENWAAEFGDDGKAQTPLGEVKMGENQYLKLAQLGRRGKLGMVRPTLENPDLIIEDSSKAKDGDTQERDSSYIFVKSFKGKDGERMYHFTSVTVRKDGKEVVISNQEKSVNRIKKLMQEGKVVFIKGESSLHPKTQMEESVPRSDSQGSTSSDNQTLGLGINSPELSESKGTNNSSSGNGENVTLTFEDGSPVPMTTDGKGRNVADYSQMTPEHGAEWIKRTFGDNADKVVDGKIKKAEAALKDAEKIKIDYSADDADIIEAETKKKEAVDAAQRDIDFFTRVKNAMKKEENLGNAGGTGATGNRYEQWRNDGYHIGEGGVRYDRQKKEDQTGVYGKEVKVDFAPKVSVKGRAKVVEIDSVQASHRNGQANPWHFGPDWQPKDRTDEASLLGQNDALNNFDPEKITGDGNAYIESAPSVNERHEVIQGNNRAEILRKLYDGMPEEAAKYKQWLIDNAERFGLDAAEIAKMKRPVLVNELPVDDATAKELGQHDVKEFESGGKAIPRTSAVINMLGDKMQSVAGILMRQGALPDDAKMSDLIAQNADKVLDYLSKEGVMTATEEQTLRKDKTTLRLWMTDLLKNGLFEGDKLSEAAFSQLPDNAQKAVLATYLRDIKSPDGAKIKQNLLRSFDAYVAMMDFPGFANAKNLAEARAAVNMEIEKGNKSLFGEDPVRERYSTFELELAAMYKGLKDQKTLTGLLDKYFDAVQGDKATNRQLELGDTPREPISKEEAIKEIFDSYDTTPAETQRQVDEAVKTIATEITKQVGEDVVVTDDKVSQSALDEAEATDSNIKFHKETDPDVLDELNSGKTIKVYRAMQVIDGKLYPPMAASIGGKLVEANELGTWIRADENPDLAIPDIDPKTGEQKVDKKTGELKWKFKLDKGGKDATGKKATDVNAAYNPYWHMSRSPLNDQFKSAWIRPNIVVVECEVPVSELTSGYKAERAKDAVGEVDWKSGSVSSEVYKQTGRARKVILSRWCKPVRVLDDAEVAQRAKEFVGEAKVEIPENVLTPKQRIAFEEAGFKIGAPEKGVKKSAQILEALEKGLQIDNSVKEHRVAAGSTVIGMDKIQKELQMNPSVLTDQILNYHGDHIARLLDEVPEDSSVKYFSAHNGTWYFYRVDHDRNIILDGAISANKDNYKEYEQKIKEYYGVDGGAEAIYNYVQEAGFDTGASRNLPDYFLEGGNTRHTTVGERPNGPQGEAGVEDNRTYGRTLRQGFGEEQGGAIKEFRSKDGEVYGFTVDGKIYLDTKRMKPETPLHEYTHLWSEALKRVNPKEWENVKKLFDEVDGLKDEVQKLYPELKGEDLYDEMIAVYSGREGTKKLEDVVRKLAAEGGKSVTDSVKAQGFIGKVKEALQRYWKGVADMLHIHFTSAEEVADKVLADWAKGIDPREIESKETEHAKEPNFSDLPVFDGIGRGDIRILKEEGWHAYKLGVTEANPLNLDAEARRNEAYERFVARLTEATGDTMLRNIKPHLREYFDYFEKKADEVVANNKPKGKTPIDEAALAYHEEKVAAARKAYEEAKASGDESETKRTRDEFKKALDDKLKAQGLGLIQRRKEIAKELGKKEAEKIDKPWEDMDGEERMATAEKNPLSEDEIRNQTSEENRDLIEDAVDYLNGNHGFAQQIAYLKIYDDVRNRHEDAPGNSGAEDGTQLASSGNGSGEGLELGTGREGGGPSGELDRGTGPETVPGELPSGKDSEGEPDLAAGERGNSEGEGGTSRLGGLPAGDTERKRSGNDGGNGTTLQHGEGRRGGSRPAKTNAKRKPAAKQGTTWRNRTEAEIKQETKDAKAGLKAAFKEMLKRGRGEANISLVGLNSRQIEYMPELMKAVKRYGMSLIDQGIYKIKDWMKNIREGIYDDMKAIGFSDKDIDDFIDEMWNSKMPMDGETHTIAEWCSIYGRAQLREKLGKELGDKYQLQMEAEPIEVKVGDMKNIEETLPFLLPQQQEDVLKAETQFFGEEHTDRDHAYGKGYMFTNGTGTGKTYTGLGIAKRLAKQGKGRILFVTPSQKKVTDWMNDGKNLGLEIRDLDSWAKEKGTTATTESGEGMVITTFANFGLNKKLLETEWDAVIYDESHRIMENKKGTETARSMQHYMVTNRDESHCFLRLQDINKHYQKMRNAADKFDAEREKEIKRIQKEYKESHPSATAKDVANATQKMLPKGISDFAPADAATFPKLGKTYQNFVQARQYYYDNVEPKLKEQAKNTWKNTKTVFLSATPFNTRENLDYAEGYIFKYPERGADGMDGRTRFYLDHFGAAYKFRYHRLEQTTSNPDAVAKQEVAFSDYLQNTLGTMSGRIIDSPYDYSRDFPTVSPDHAEEFNQAVQDAVRGRYLGSAYRKTIGDYNYGSALFETMKVANIIDRIKQHLDAGRKVVIFHRRVETKKPLEAPFAYMLAVANNDIAMMRPGEERDKYIKEVNDFRNKYAGLLQWEKTLDYSMPREQIAKVFGKDNVLFFSGKESKKAKDKAVDVFNDDDSGKNIIVIQEASGKEGISLHDKTGKHQRVCITLGLPQSPITALQIEGRTYRIGNKSNAIFEYPILGLNSEMLLFGEKFNNQVSTTENLALGSQARNLRDSFANGILEHSGVVPIDQQGVGGKEFDAPKQGESDPFDNAVLDYYSNQKLNKRNREGVDYFPTPEPLGYKMMEWAKAGEGDTILEPSAGHGAIARYAPKENMMTSIEPSQSLFTKLQLKAGGLGRKFLNNIFENYDISNKHDVVVMNPPFGTAGATAIAHLDKAFKHLDEGGRVVAIIPRGSTDKKFDKWYDGQKNVAMRAEVDLPDIVFQQAGTKVRCRVVVLDKITDDALRSKAGYPEKIDLSGHYDKIEDFFEELRDIDMPERIIDTQAKMMKKARAAKTDINSIKDVREVKLNKNGILVTLKGDWTDYGISFSGSDNPQYWREKMSTFYNKYEELEKSSWNENKKAVCSELKELACKLAGMTEEEMQRYIAGHNNGEAQGEVYFRIDGEENSSEELFLSLQNKKGKDYYDTVTEIARRVAEGKARLTSLPEEYERKGVLSTPHAAARIIASAWVRERNGSSESIKRRNNDNGAVSVHLDKDGRDSCEVQIETWAKQNGCWIDENDYISKEYQTSHGDEARVYFVGNKVVKFADYKKLHGEDGISSYLDRITLMNTIDPEAALKIIGFGRDKDGKFRVVLEQKKFAKTFNFEHDDEWNITAIGNKQISDFYDNDAPIIKRQFAKKGIEYDPNDWISYYKNEIEISDVGMTNIAKDENGRYHFIDVTARVLSQGKEESSDKPMLIDNIAAKNDNALGVLF